MFIFTLTWVISNVYHSLSTSTIDIPLAESIISIEGSFDTKTIDELKNRKQVEVTDDIITPVGLLQNDRNATNSAQLEANSDLEVSTESAETEL